MDPQRSPRFLEVATLRVRLQYTQLVDLAEGFCPAFELPGQPYVGDPSLPPRTGNPEREGGEAPVPPVSVPREESVRATTPKAKPAPPGEASLDPKGSPAETRASELPRRGEPTASSHRQKPSTSRPRGHKRGVSPEKEESDKKGKEREGKSEDKRRRSASSSRKQRKRSRRTRSRERRRSRSRRRAAAREPRTPERRERDPSTRIRVKGELVSSEERKKAARPSVPEPAHHPSRGEGSRVPRPPSVPPPERSGWTGPIRAPRREPDNEGQWPKSKGVKRREKNRAFREANYGRNWYPRDYRR